MTRSALMTTTLFLAALLTGAAAPARADTVAADTAAARGGAPALPDAAVGRSERDGATVFRIDGVITPVVARRLAEALAALPQTRPVELELNSPGGFTSAGYAMIDRVQAERQAGRRVATRVRDRDACESMCFGVFMAGYPRFAAPDARFMVHAPRGLGNGRVTLRSTKAMIDRMLALGVSADWLTAVKAAGGFSGAVDYRQSGRQLAAAKANVVTDLTR